MARYKRILLKLSGESLSGDAGHGFDPESMSLMCRQINDVRESGVEIAVVVGAGNLFRGMPASAGGAMDRVTADQMGMLATMMNGLALRESFYRMGISTTVMSARSIEETIEPFHRDRAVHRLGKGHILIFVGGTGNPFFTTDTAAALRAAQISADVVLKGTKVDGVYDGDPVKNPDARKFEKITFDEVLTRGLKVMDATAFAMCRDNNIPIVVFNMLEKGTLLRLTQGETLGTVVSCTEN